MSFQNPALRDGDARRPLRPARFDNGAPLLLVVIDTEEEFDWSAPFDRKNRAVTNIAEQVHAQALCERYGVTPTYIIDYPVASTPESVAVFRDWAASGRAVVGAHLHPWVNPPEIEDVNRRNSYPGNLEPEVERAKLEALTRTIAENVGQRPTIYKAGRYGIGPNTPGILSELGYDIDLSVVPATNYDGDGGPDFRGFPHEPYWFGPDASLFEVPLTRGFPGALSRWGEPIYELASQAALQPLRLPGILSRLGLVERIQMTPEGITLAENIRLARHLARIGRRVFTYAYHSSTLLPGGSPYVRTMADRERFLQDIEGFLKFFTTELGGRGTTPQELKALAQAA
ncbi:polysaccharide deacetylase family protein [Govanella unica]|uniref:Polysaccharide deacetylase family protein n=1 Tax=Govanella unica TaxID=2975056 RepID=A0A9X3Z6V6_9PROT|nr:polysaccharide deacetylase family protein [Govania unica]MDA5193590.1 polysaccharide deacetylase family protein [Govania unica]